MGRYSTISVHNKHFKYELDPDLVFNYDNRKIEYIYKDPETLKQVKDTITAKALKITRRKPIDKIQSVLCCKQDSQPLLVIIALDLNGVNHIYWYNILNKSFIRSKPIRPIKGDISLASVSPVPFKALHKGNLGDTTVVSTYALVITTLAGENTLLMVCLDNKSAWKAPLIQEDFASHEEQGHVTAIYILPADDHDTRSGHGDPQILLGFSEGNIYMYRLRATEYKSRIKRLRSPIDLSEFAEYPGYPITQLSCARLYNSLALTVAFAQDNPKDNAKYKYSRPYVKLVETHGDLTVKQRKIINPPLTAIAPSIVETKLIPATTSPSSNQLQLSIILLDQNSSQFYLSIWHVTPGIITEALALDIDRLTCLRIMMNRKAVKQSLKLSGNGYLLHQPQKIASIILGENKDKEPLPSSINEESETETRKQAQLGPEQDESEEEEVLPTKRTRVLIVRNEAWDEVSTGSMSGGEEEGRKRRKRNKRDIIPTVVAHNSPTDSEEEEKESPSIMTATPSSVEPPSSMAVLEDEDTNMEEYVEQKIDGANETSQLDTQHSLEIPLVSEAASQQQLSHDKQLQDDQQTKANSEQPILVEKNSASLQENQSDHYRHESTEEVAKQDQIKHPADNSQSIQVQQPVQEKRELIVENLKLIEIQAIESANKDLEPAAESVKEIIEPEDIQGPEEDYTFVNKVDETITSKNISTANINEIDDNDGDYDQYDDYNPTDSYDGYENDDVKADFVSTPKNGDETCVILTSDEDEEGTQSQDEEEINDIVNHAVSEPLRIDGNQREASSVVDEEYVDPLMSHSLLYQGEIQFIPGGELYIGTDQASTTTPTTTTTTSIIDIESQTSSQPSLDYIPVSNDDLLRLLNEPMTLGTNVQEADSTNTLLSMFMEDHTGSHSDGGTPALSVDFPTATFPNATTAVSSPSSPQSANEPSMTKEEEFEARMSKIALDVAQMCFETSEIDLDTLSSAKQDQMGQYCWKSNDHELKLFMMRYCHDHGMNQAVVMLGRSLLSREERSYMSTNEAKECKSILKHHLFTVHPSLREGAIINPFTEQSRKDLLQLRNSYFKQESSISSSFYQSEQGKPYVDYYGFGTKFF